MTNGKLEYFDNFEIDGIADVGRILLFTLASIIPLPLLRYVSP